MENIDKIPVGTAEDLTGKTFGRLTVQYRVKNLGKTRGAKWRCKCSCGKEVDVLASNLKRFHTLSCGCIQKEKASQTHLINEIGNRYGRLVVLERGESQIGSHVTWKCQCDCGNVVEVNGESLRKGLTTSCGCYQKERVSNRSVDKYTGKTFHFLQVLKKLEEKQSNGESLWLCKCNICGQEFVASTGKLKTQISCGCLKESFGVITIKNILNENNIQFETEKTFEDCIFEDTKRKARFDFYVNNEYIIEYDGQQHFTSSKGWNTEEQLEKTKVRDKIKNEWCRKNNIPLIRIPYWAKDSLTLEDLTLKSQFLLAQEGGDDE